MRSPFSVLPTTTKPRGTIPMRERTEAKSENHKVMCQDNLSRGRLNTAAPCLLSCATRLLHHLSGIFQEQASRGPIRTVTFTDRKLRQRIREKKMAMGHKPDDHEDAEISMR